MAPPEAMGNEKAVVRFQCDGRNPRLPSMPQDVGMSIAGKLGRHRGVASQACTYLRTSVGAARALGLFKVKVLGVAAGGTSTDGRDMVYTILCTSDGVVAFGANYKGQLGLGHEFDASRPALVGSMTGKKVVGVATSAHHTAMRTDTGEVFTCGYGEYGKLGHGSAKDASNPRSVCWLTGGGRRAVAVAVAAGYSHTAVITDAGELFTFGNGRRGRLGLDVEHPPRYAPTRVEALVGKRVTCVAAGDDHTVVCTDKGEVYTFGGGKDGRLGHGSEDDVRTPRRVEGLVGRKATAVAAGGRFTAVVANAGELFTFGMGMCGELGHGTPDSEFAPRLVEGPLAGKTVAAVAAGFCHTVACSDDGEVFTCGYGMDGRLGHGRRENELAFCRVEALVGTKIVLVAAGYSHTVVCTSAGDALTFGRGMQSPNLQHTTATEELLPCVVDFRYPLGPQ